MPVQRMKDVETTAETEDALRVPPRKMVSQVPQKPPRMVLRSRRLLELPLEVMERTNAATETDREQRLEDHKLVDKTSQTLLLPLLLPPTHSSRTLQPVEMMDSRKSQLTKMAQSVITTIAVVEREETVAAPLVLLVTANPLRNELQSL